MGMLLDLVLFLGDQQHVNMCCLLDAKASVRVFCLSSLPLITTPQLAIAVAGRHAEPTLNSCLQ